MGRTQVDDLLLEKCSDLQGLDYNKHFSGGHLLPIDLGASCLSVVQSPLNMRNHTDNEAITKIWEGEYWMTTSR